MCIVYVRKKTNYQVLLYTHALPPVNVNGGEYNGSDGGGRSLGIPKWQQKITTLIM